MLLGIVVGFAAATLIFGKGSDAIKWVKSLFGVKDAE